MKIIDALMAEVEEPIAATFRGRENLSVSHIISSAFFARNSFDIEQNCSQKTPQEIPEEVRWKYWAYGIGSVFSAVAFLEATINEVFLDAVDIQRGQSGIVRPLDSDVKESMARFWNEKKAGSCHDFENVIYCLTSSLEKGKSYCKGRSVDFWYTLDKYQLALRLKRHFQFDKNSLSWESVNTLIAFRHFLIHYKPGWTILAAPEGEYEGPENNDEVKLQNKLNDYKICTNPLYQGSLFPYKCLGWKGANWAVESSLKFTDEFFDWMGLKPNYDSSRHFLNTKI